MTEDERKQLDELSRQTKKMHDAFFVPVIGSEKNLIEKLVAVVNAYEKGGWFVRAMFIGIPAVGALILGWDRIKSFFKGL